MKTHSHNRFGLPVLALLFPLLVSLACGSSTAQELASAVPPTTASVEATDSSPSQAQSTESIPTTAPQPTEAPPTPAELKPLTVIAQGFGQDDRELGFAFIIENSNPGHAVEGSQYQVY